MKVPDSTDNSVTNVNEETCYLFYSKEEVKRKPINEEKLLSKFDNIFNKKSILFNFIGESKLSDHIIKIDFYKDKQYVITKEEILAYKNKIMKNNHKYQVEYKKEEDDTLEDRIEKIVNILKDYIIDIKIYLTKTNLDVKEIEIFNNKIKWMRNLFERISKESSKTILERLDNEFYDLDYSYVLVIDFLKKYFNNVFL